MLSFDRERRTIGRNSRVHFRWAERRQIQIAQSGLVFPFWADLFIELHAIARERLADHILIELRNPSASGGWRQDLTMVGPPDACRNFDACLLSDEEVELGPRLWRSFVDPFKEG